MPSVFSRTAKGAAVRMRHAIHDVTILAAKPRSLLCKNHTMCKHSCNKKMKAKMNAERRFNDLKFAHCMIHFARSSSITLAHTFCPFALRGITNWFLQLHNVPIRLLSPPWTSVCQMKRIYNCLKTINQVVPR